MTRNVAQVRRVPGCDARSRRQLASLGRLRRRVTSLPQVIQRIGADVTIGPGYGDLIFKKCLLGAAISPESFF